MEYNSVNLPFGKQIWQTKSGLSITSDTAELVHYILDKHDQQKKFVLELGSGNGIISLMLKFYRPSWYLTGIEIQTHLHKLSEQNAQKLDVEVDFQEEDIRMYDSSINYDLIVSNPPYFPLTDGKISPNLERAIAKSELMVTLSDIIFCIKRNLSRFGSVYLIYPEERWQDLENLIKKVDLQARQKKILKMKNKKSRMIVEIGN